MHTDIVTFQFKNQPVTTSHEIARVTGIAHDMVLRSIRNVAKLPACKHFEIIERKVEKFGKRSIGRPTKEVLIPSAFAEILMTRFKTTQRLKTANTFYIVAFDNGIKIGCCNDFKRRLKQYQQPFCRPILKYWEYTSPNAFNLETAAKKHFRMKSHKTNHEFLLNVNFKHIQSFVLRKIQDENQS